MTQLLGLFAIVVGSYGALTLWNMLGTRHHLSRALRGRLSMALLFAFTGMSHFFMPEAMAQMLPPFVPFRVEIIYITGVLEILGAMGLLVPRLQRLAGAALIFFLIGVLPANIYAAMNYVDFGAHGDGPIYLLARVPFQLFLMGWIYFFVFRTARTPAADSLRPVWRHS